MHIDGTLSASSPSAGPAFRSRGRAATFLVPFLVAATLPVTAAGDSAKCARAAEIVKEVQTLYQAAKPPYLKILEKLKVAQDLCPLSGDVWKYAYCSAQALGDLDSVRRFRQRAVDNDVAQLDCEAERKSAPPAAAPLSPFVREKFALVVGVGTFADPKIKTLTYAAKDAIDFAHALEDPKHGRFKPSNITVLTDRSATRDAILGALDSIIRKAHEEDLVVIYVSSHGSPGLKDRGLAGNGYILTYDTAVEKLWSQAIEYQTFAKQTGLIQARRKVTFLDTCFSGQAGGGAKSLELETGGPDEKTSRMFASNEGSFVVTSSNSTETSWESQSVPNSYFTHFLIEAMTRSKEPPTMKEIFRYIAAKVPEAAYRERHEEQHPQMQPLDGPDDITIGVVPSGDVRQLPTPPSG